MSALWTDDGEENPPAADESSAVRFGENNVDKSAQIRCSKQL